MLCMVIVTWCLTDRTWPEPFLSKHTNSSCRIRKFSYLASPSRFRVSLVSMLGLSGSLIATSYHHVIVSTQCVVFVWRNPRSQFEKAPRLALAEKQGIFAFIITQKKICADRRIIFDYLKNCRILRFSSRTTLSFPYWKSIEQSSSWSWSPLLFL